MTYKFTIHTLHVQCFKMLRNVQNTHNNNNNNVCRTVLLFPFMNHTGELVCIQHRIFLNYTFRFFSGTKQNHFFMIIRGEQFI